MDLDAEHSMPKHSDDSRTVCRLCSSREELLEDAFDQMGLRQWISDYLSIEVNQDDGLSQIICTRCLTQLKEFREFQQRCIGVQNVLLNGTVKSEPESSDGTDEKVCRFCLSKKCVDETFHQGDLPRWISDYLSIILDQDCKSRFCCTVCKIQLEDFRNFQLRCLEVQNELLNGKPTSVKNEPAKDIGMDSETSSISEAITEGEPSIECKVCHKVIKGTKNLKDSLRYHMVIHGPKKHACTVCSKAFAKSSGLKDHMKTHFKDDNDNQAVECEVCHKIFKNINTLRVHRASHGPRKHVCPTCNKAFAVRQNYRNHMDTHHSSVPLDGIEQHSDHPFKCDICFKILKNKISLRQHKKTHLPKKKVCSICSAAFAKNRDLEDHMAMHNVSNGSENGQSPSDNPFKCEICHKTYQKLNSLRQHIKIHGQEKHVCTLCNKEFAERRRLSQHLQTHNKFTQYEEVGEADLEEFLCGEPFQCALCPKMYHFEKDLSKHTRNVHKSRTLPCKSSTDQSALGSDVDQKSGQLEATHAPLHLLDDADDEDTHPFKCTVCQKAFRSKDQLLDHARKVRAKMNYQCTICRKRFATRNLLYQHTKEAIHAEGKTLDNENGAQKLMETYDAFEAGEIKVEVQSSDDDE
ncbi:zinc finger protein Xfin isoform X2 [Aedes aegypti]|uniref:Uncharacterized protein n=1 Tax=Aedes aegypti TaxID=7159 RepID=A0A1S4G7R6_AEDAE|nr:zinc finger protein Xfin isoform X2 [Aedes aegypti]